MPTLLARLPAASLLVLCLAACAGSDTGKTKSAVSKGGYVAALTAAAKSAPNSLVLGQPVTGALESSDPTLPDSSYYDQWIYDGRRGERIQVTLESSAFDAFLILARQNGESVEMLEQDDDGAGGSNARISIELPDDGSYLVMANSYGGGVVGAYTLRVDRGGTGNTSQRPAAPVDYATRYPGGGDPKGRYALLVGINDYQGIGTSLSTPVADARLIGRILVERYGFLPANVKYITDREATREHIAAAFIRHLGQAGPDGVAVFYYSGHGMQLEDNMALTGTLDPEPDDVDEAIAVWGDDGRGGMLVDDELGFLASRLRTDRALLILDSCHSGTATMGAAGAQSKELQFSEVKGNISMPASFLTEGAAAGSMTAKSGSDLIGDPERHILLAAATNTQLSWTAGGWPKYGGAISLFTYFLADALEAAEPNATFTQVMRQVREKTDTWAQTNLNTRQTPQLEGTQEGASIREFLRQR